MLLCYYLCLLEKAVLMKKLYAGVRYWGSGREWPLHELAWGHDLVITTFTRLSADWTHHPTTSPLKQVQHPTVQFVVGIKCCAALHASIV